MPRQLRAGDPQPAQGLRPPATARARTPREAVIRRVHGAWVWLVAWADRLAWGTVALGAVFVLVGLSMVTVFSPGPTVDAEVSGVRARPVVEAVPGMLDLLDRTVTVRVTGATPDAPVFVGVGRDTDVTAYLGRTWRTQLTGLRGGERPVTREEMGGPLMVDPTGVDIWAASARGTGGARLTWREQPGTWRLVVTGGPGSGPESVTLSWPRPERSGPPALIALGVLMIVSGLVGVALLRDQSRKEELR